MAPHRLGLSVAPLPLPVLVALVGRDHEHHPHVGPGADGVEDVDRSHHIDLEGLPGLGERAPHERLGGHVDHNLGPESLKR